MGKAHLKSVFGFSTFVLLSDIVGNLQGSAGVFVLGTVLTTAALGQFAFAVYLTDTPRRLAMSILNRVTFVHFSQNKHDKDYLREKFASIVRWNCRMLFPVMTSMMLFGPGWVTLFLGPEWAGIGPVVFWLSLSTIVGTAGGATSNLFKSMGRPALNLWLSVFTTIVVLFPVLYLRWSRLRRGGSGDRGVPRQGPGRRPSPPRSRTAPAPSGVRRPASRR